MLAQIAQALFQGSAEALALASATGADARPAVLGALQHPSPTTRHLAVACLRTIADPRDVPVYFSLLADPALTVRIQAAQALLENHASIPFLGDALIDALKAASDPEVRIPLTTALGDRTDADVAALADLETQQADPDVRAQFIAALAKQGSQPHVNAFRRALSVSRGEARIHWLGLAEYVCAPFMLPDLAAMLDDEENLISLGHCHSSDESNEGPRYLRTCDYAARLIGQITHEIPAFAEQNGWVGLTPEQRGVMREIALRHSPHEPSTRRRGSP